MTPSDVRGIAQAIKQSEMAGMEAELMRANVAGKIARFISSVLPVGQFDIHVFLDDCGLQVPNSPTDSPFFNRQNVNNEDRDS